MNCSSPSSPHGQLNPDEPTVRANAVVALALLRCIEVLPGQFPARDYDDLGQVLAPFIGILPTPLKLRLASAVEQVHASNGRARLAATSEADALADPEHAAALGEALCQQAAAMRPVLRAVQERLQQFCVEHPHDAAGKVRRLAEELGLAGWERAFLNLAAALHSSTFDSGILCFVKTPLRLRRAVERVCAASAEEAFDWPSPTLRRCGLFVTDADESSRADLEDLLALSGLGVRLLFSAHDTADALTAAVLQPLPPPDSDAALAWPHLAPWLEVAQAALRGAIATGAQGFNLLLHGAPGAGKTAFARQLVHEMGACGYQVENEDREGLEATRRERLASLALGQLFTRGQRNAVLVLDEAEDILPLKDPFFGGRFSGRSSMSKAWINHLLEHNPKPVIWIGNQVEQLDEAYLRRFSLCIRFPETPYGLRQAFAERRLAELQVSPAVIEAAADCPLMSPALLDHTVRLIGLARSDVPAAAAPSADRVVQAVLQGHSEAAGQHAPRSVARAVLRFDPAYLRLADGLSVADVREASRDEQGANLLFHGPPGTGKTQFAAALARDLGRRLVVRTASDIHSKWYGQSEANVAQMFHACDPRSEMLLLDEAEVLLGARADATHRADHAVTAEFLRWLECFEGVLVCATNHPDRLDAALQRRFVLRVGFLPMDMAQRLALLRQLAGGALGGKDGEVSLELSMEQHSRLQALDALTPGDFANVARRLSRRSNATDDWLHELQLEQQAKAPGRAARIGFV